MKYFKKLVGKNVYLSPRNTEAAELFTKWFNDLETTEFLARSAEVMTLEGERKYLEENSNKEGCFVIVTLKEEKMIGSIALESINRNHRIATLGIFIGDKEYREKGYGTEAINLILDFGFNYLNLNNIRLDVLEFNERAINCYKKCGFKEYGRRRKSRYINGKYYDVISMDILAEEFKGNYIANKVNK